MKLLKLILVLALYVTVAPVAISREFASHQEKEYVVAFGEVNKPGMFEFTQDMTLRRALTLFEGTTSNADISRVVVIRKDRSEIPVDLTAVLNGRNEDVALHAGDVIVVPSLTRTHFIVAGEANRPGVFDFKQGMTLRRAAILFDGTTSKASLSRAAILRKDQTNEIRRIPIDLEGVMGGRKEDVPILVDDIIIIPEFGVAKIP